VLFKKHENSWKIMAPPDLIHDNHFGVGKTYNLIKDNFYYKGLKKATKKYVISCLQCQQHKLKCTKYSKDFRPIMLENPGELLSADVFGPLPTSRDGSKYVLVLLDVFSKFIKLYPLRRATTGAIIRSYEKYFKVFGKPERILSDLGTQFTAKNYAKKLKEWNIKITYTSVRHPRGNPVERCMRELGRLCRTYCENSHQSWAHQLVQFENWLNDVTHQTTGFPPNQLHRETKSNWITEVVAFPPDNSTT
jgi:hypothetical protein